jgi:hypothetical protein
LSEAVVSKKQAKTASFSSGVSFLYGVFSPAKVKIYSTQNESVSCTSRFVITVISHLKWWGMNSQGQGQPEIEPVDCPHCGQRRYGSATSGWWETYPLTDEEIKEYEKK